MASQWFYQVMGDRIGPVSGSQLRNLALRGAISIDTPIANAADGPWVPAERVRGLFGGPVRTPSAAAKGRAQVRPSDACVGDEPSGVSVTTKTMLAVLGGICVIAIGFLVWLFIPSDTWQVDHSLPALVRLEEADRLQQSDPLAARRMYDEVLVEVKRHKITDERLAKKIADAEKCRATADRKVQEKIRAEETERQRAAEGGGKKWANPHVTVSKPASEPAATAIPAVSSEPFDLKGDRLGMSLQKFKAKYDRKVQGHNESAPFCSDAMPGQEISTLLAEPWHTRAGIVNCSITFPFEAYRGGAPTIGDVKTELLVHHFVDGKLYRISAWFPHDGYLKVAAGMIARHGPPAHRETNSYQNRFGATFTGEELIWDNAVSTIALTERFGDLNTSSLIFAHRKLSAIVETRTPTPTGHNL